MYCASTVLHVKQAKAIKIAYLKKLNICFMTFVDFNVDKQDFKNILVLLNIPKGITIKRL